MAEAGQRSLWPAQVSRRGSSLVDPPVRARAVFADPGYARQLWISIYFNILPFEVRFDSNFSDGAVPRAVVATDGNRARVLLCNPAATARGVCPDQKLNTALALAPELETADRDPAAEDQAMADFANWAMRFTPSVSLAAGNALLLDVRGSLRLFGGFE